jgi:alkylation response protein AidB-like acyl-CoA dehydrogenase
MTTNGSDVLDAVMKIVPDIAARANEIEELRRVPSDLIERLRAAGAFRMLLPKEYGGEGLEMVQVVAVIEAVARADASAGWTVMVGGDFPVFLSHFPHATIEKFYASGPNVLARGAFAPKGVAVPVDGGYTVNGQWPLASGSYDFEWVVGGCIIIEEGAPRMLEDGRPDIGLALVKPDDVEFLDTWHSVGLRSTLSQDFTMKDVFVPEEQMGPFFGGSNFESDNPLYRLPGVPLGPTHNAVVQGIALGALDDLIELSKSKRPAFNPLQTLKEDPIFTRNLGKLAVRIEGLRALTERQSRRMWEAGASDAAPDPIADLPGSVSLVHTEGVDIVNEMFTLAGATVVYETASLQRRWRDVRVAAQHFAASPTGFDTMGGLLLGEDARVPAGVRT